MDQPRVSRDAWTDRYVQHRFTQWSFSPNVGPQDACDFLNGSGAPNPETFMLRQGQYDAIRGAHRSLISPCLPYAELEARAEAQFNRYRRVYEESIRQYAHDVNTLVQPIPYPIDTQCQRDDFTLEGTTFALPGPGPC